MSEDEIVMLHEDPRIYDGWSVAEYADGSLVNRWESEDGNAIPGYERRWSMTKEIIARMREQRTGTGTEAVR